MARAVFALLLLVSLVADHALGCSNFIVSAGATVDGSTLISYAADSHTLYGELYYYPAADYPAGATLDIYDWDSGKYLTTIPQVNHTYRVVGSINEFQVAIGETTYGGREELADPAGLIDYGTLMWVGLQRSKTARELIATIDSLVNGYGYGYASEGESFSISDPHEVWIMEIIAKGPNSKGAVWAARRVPDGYICGHANQARITQLPQNDVDTLYSPDVISFARDMGYFNGDDSEFSFSDTYNPVTGMNARTCEARVWSFFRSVVGDSMETYYDYVHGDVTYDSKTGYATNRMPLWVKPSRKLKQADLFDLMRDHYEDTPLDLHDYPGSGDGLRPYRWRPMTFTVNGVDYLNERSVGTQQTGFSFIAEGRSWLPDPVGGILWFGVDDTGTTVYTPFYCGMLSPPENFKKGNGDMMTYSDTSAFWLWNRVANFVYLRYNYMIVDVQTAQAELEEMFTGSIASADTAAVSLYKSNVTAALNYLTEFSHEMASTAFSRWQQLDRYLLIKYIDGNIKQEKNGEFLTNGYGQSAMPNQPGFPQWYYDNIVETSGDLHLVPTATPPGYEGRRRNVRDL